MTRNLEIDVFVSDDNRARWPSRVVECCQTAANAVFATTNPKFAAAEVSILLTSADQSRALNRDYRGYDKPTNVLAFAFQDADVRKRDFQSSAVEQPVTLGDVVVAYEICAAEACAAGKSFINHLCHLIVHGILHLLGYDHQSRTDAERMEQVEIAVLDSLGIPNPYEEAWEPWRRARA